MEKELCLGRGTSEAAHIACVHDPAHMCTQSPLSAPHLLTMLEVLVLGMFSAKFQRSVSWVGEGRVLLPLCVVIPSAVAIIGSAHAAGRQGSRCRSLNNVHDITCQALLTKEACWGDEGCTWTGESSLLATHKTPPFFRTRFCAATPIHNIRGMPSCGGECESRTLLADGR
jgi:hypothetical protein